MQVEVNEENIVKYSLVQLTGNSAEDLLVAAREAEINGYVLTCRIPDAEEVVETNVFDSALHTEIVDDDELEAYWTHQNPIVDPEPKHRLGRHINDVRVINISVDAEPNAFGEGIEIVDGEVVESHTEEDS